MVNKKHVCPVCRKAFSTKQSLTQHRRSTGHGGAVGQGRRRGGGGGSFSGAPISQSTQVPATSSSPSFPISAQFERLATEAVAVRSAEGSTIYELECSSLMSHRLANLSSSFQRVDIRSATLHVTGKAGSTVSGGYLVGFIADIADAVTVDSLGSSPGARSMKWWESTASKAVFPRQSFYTTPQDAKDRFHTPGKWVVMVDGTPSSTVSVTFHLSWDVVFSVPVSQAYVSHQDPLLVAVDLWSVKGQPYVSDKAGSTEPGHLVKGSISYGVYKLSTPASIEYYEGVGDTGTILCYYVYINHQAIFFSTDGSTATDKKWQSDVDVQLVIPVGTTLTSKQDLVRGTRRRLRSSALSHPNVAISGEPQSRQRSPSASSRASSKGSFVNC